MSESKKKEYEKPEATRVTLDAKGAVLGFCKTTETLGPLAANFGVGVAPCSREGS